MVYIEGAKRRPGGAEHFPYLVNLHFKRLLTNVNYYSPLPMLRLIIKFLFFQFKHRVTKLYSITQGTKELYIVYTRRALHKYNILYTLAS